MSRRFRGYETYFKCDHCSQSWGGPRRVQRQGFSRQAKALAEQDADVQRQYREAEQHLAGHLARRHRPEQIAERMAEIEREATWAQEHAERTGEEQDWATDPLAVEWRALMKEWWALPSSQITERAARLSPTYNRSLLVKGRLAPQTAGERHMSTVSAHQRKLRLERSAA